MHALTHRQLVRIVPLVMFATFGIACGGDGEPDSGGLEVSVENLSPSTVVLFTVRGDGIVESAIGARGSEVTSGISTARFTRLPEGQKIVYVYAWNQNGGTTGDDPDLVGEDPGWHTYDLTQTGDSGIVNIQGGVTRSVAITASNSNRQYLNVSKFMLNGQYIFDAGDIYAGSVDGSNWAVLHVDGTGRAGEAVYVEVNTPRQEEVGLFPTMPPETGVFDAPTNWNFELTGTLDDDGDFACAVMAMPGMSGRDVRIDVYLGADAEPETTYIRVAGLAHLNVSGE